MSTNPQQIWPYMTYGNAWYLSKKGNQIQLRYWATEWHDSINDKIHGHEFETAM